MRTLSFTAAGVWAHLARLAAVAVAVLLACPAWTPTPPMGEKRGRHTATVLADGRVLVAGGMHAVAFEPDYYPPQRPARAEDGVRGLIYPRSIPSGAALPAPRC